MRPNRAAARALSWPLAVWIEAGLWFTLGLALVAGTYVSWDSVATVASKLAGFGDSQSRAFVLCISAPLWGSILAQALLARWCAGEAASQIDAATIRSWRASLLAVTIVSAVAELSCNALRGPLDAGQIVVKNGLMTFTPDVPTLVATGAVSVVPAACIVATALCISVALTAKSRLIQLAGGTSGPRRVDTSGGQAGGQRGGQRSTGDQPVQLVQRPTLRVLAVERVRDALSADPVLARSSHQEIAARFGVSTKTVQRAFRELAGTPGWRDADARLQTAISGGSPS